MNPIEEFWLWFRMNEHQLTSQYSDVSTRDEIDALLERINPMLGWEIGPIDNEHLYFSVSPELDESLVDIAKAVVSAAYRSDSWEFRVGRQRRPWSDVLQVGDDQADGQSLAQLDLSAWRHIAFRVQDSELIDIVFECGDQFPASVENLDELGTMIAISLIGEMELMKKVNSIEVVRRLDGKHAEKAKPAEWLPYVFGLKPI